jgi:Ser/Thr protein kinase RdoA (MazF antagonist)
MKTDRQLFHLKTDGPAVCRNKTEERYGLFYRRTLTQNYAGLKREIQIAAKLREAGVPVPNGVFVKYGDLGHQVWDRAKGVSLDKLDQEQRSMAYRKLGALLAKVHAIPGDGAGLVDGTEPIKGGHEKWSEYLISNVLENISYLVDNSLVVKEGGDAILSAIRSFCKQESTVNRPLFLLHGDLNDRNVFFHNGEISAIIDWEDALVGDPVFDLVSWAAFTRPGWIGNWDCILPFYYGEQAAQIVSDTDWQNRFWVYYLRISVSRLVFLNKAGYKDLRVGVERVTMGVKKLEAIT